MTNLGERLKSWRKERKLSLQQLSDLSNVSKASLSKVENNKMSLTYAKLQDLSRGLGIDVTQLFQETADAAPPPPTAGSRRSIDRIGTPETTSTHHYSYTYLHTDLLQRSMVPFRMRLKARSMQQFGELIRHSGEEFVYVVSGQVEVHTSAYAPAKLGPGDSLYIDSTMGHGYLSASEEDAVIICVCNATTPENPTAL